MCIYSTSTVELSQQVGARGLYETLLKRWWKFRCGMSKGMLQRLCLARNRRRTVHESEDDVHAASLKVSPNGCSQRTVSSCSLTLHGMDSTWNLVSATRYR